MKIRLTLKSYNRKTGPIPVTTSDARTCPDACPLKAGGCYAAGGPLAIVWRQVPELGLEWPALLVAIRNFPARQLFRHNQAGDLAGTGDRIDATKLAQLTRANVGKRGFTYTHKPVLKSDGPHSAHNSKAIKAANAGGFAVNLSANSLAHADRLAALAIGPVVSIVPQDTPARFTTPEGRRGIVCPAQIREGKVTCSTCGICSRPRSVIVGFRPHGASHKKAEAIAKK